MPSGSVPLANALRDIAWLLPRTLGRAPNPTLLLPRSELEVMRLLAQRPGLSVNEVAADLGIRPPNVSAAISSLVTRGQLERRRDPTDGRVVRLYPTRSAMRIRAAQERAWGEALDEVIAELDAQHRETLREATASLAILAKALAHHTPPPTA